MTSDLPNVNKIGLGTEATALTISFGVRRETEATILVQLGQGPAVRMTVAHARLFANEILGVARD